jgi:hypothetical protein
VADNIFSHWDLLDALNIDLTLMNAVVKRIGEGYKAENPYHNALHAADVMHACHLFAVTSKIIQLAEVEHIHLFSYLFAAIIHDYKHPGFTNTYLVNTKDKIAFRYNDRAVLESYHVAQAFQEMVAP